MKRIQSGHIHFYRVGNIGAGLQRAVCTECRQVSIRLVGGDPGRELPPSQPLLFQAAS